MCLSQSKDTCSLHPCEGRQQEGLPEAARGPNSLWDWDRAKERSQPPGGIGSVKQRVSSKPPKKYSPKESFYIFFICLIQRVVTTLVHFLLLFLISSPPGFNRWVRYHKQQVGKMSKEEGVQPISPFRQLALFLINIWITKPFINL